MGMPTPNVKTAVNAKMRVLRDFYVVDDDNESQIRGELEAAVRESKSLDYNRVLDRVARDLINAKWGREY